MKLLDCLRGFFTKPSTEKRLFFEAVILLWSVRLALWFLPLHACQLLVDRAASRGNKYHLLREMCCAIVASMR